jgi:hypothetical protein
MALTLVAAAEGGTDDAKGKNRTQTGTTTKTKQENKAK